MSRKSIVNLYLTYIASTALSYPVHWVHDILVRYKHLIPCIGYPLLREEDCNPFFIVGAGRSGNTLLRRVLYAHPELHIPPETYRLGWAIKLFRQNRTLDWKTLVHLTLSEFEYHPQFETFNVSLRDLVLQLIEAPKEVRSLAFILDSFYRYHAEQQGRSCKRWGDKTPINVYWLDLIYRVFPDAQFIHLVRDGCDVVSSYMANDLVPDIESAAIRWVTSLRAADNFVQKHPSQCLVIRYEDFVTNPGEIVREVCDFLEVKFYDDMLASGDVAPEMGDVSVCDHHAQVYQPISPSAVGKGRRSLTLDQKMLLQDMIGKQLDKWGYDPCL